MEIYGYYFTFSLAELIALGVLLLAFVYQLYFYIRYMNAVLRQNKNIDKQKIIFETSQPSVSVIVCAKDEAKNLRKFLPSLLEQDYPEYEIIVINDGSTDETEDLLRDMCLEFPRLRTTFVPVGANNRSTKKLAITLGVKASRYDYLLFTDADCMPKENTWISRMMRNFSPGVEFVLGYGAYFEEKSFLNRLITYDTLFIALQYMGMAIGKKPYMGVGRNMAYRKETFYAQKGFASNLHLISGDDDLMVNKAATASNTRVEVSVESITFSEPNNTFKGWLYQKERHLSVASYYKQSTKNRLFAEPFTRGLFYLAFIGSLILGNILTISSAGLFFIVRYLVQISTINRSSAHFGGRKYIASLLIFDIYLPLVNLWFFLFGKKQKNIKWK